MSGILPLNFQKVIIWPFSTLFLPLLSSYLPVLSDIFRFWHFPVLKDSDICRFWHFPFLKDSDIFIFWRFPVLKDSDIFRFWQFPVLKDSDKFPILTSSDSDIFRFWRFQILTFSVFDKKWILTFSDSDMFSAPFFKLYKERAEFLVWTPVKFSPLFWPFRLYFGPFGLSFLALAQIELCSSEKLVSTTDPLRNNWAPYSHNSSVKSAL